MESKKCHILRNISVYFTFQILRWHLGNCKPEYLPQNRGFETFFGYWSGQEDYFNHTLSSQTAADKYFDFFFNDEIFRDVQGKYTTVS